MTGQKQNGYDKLPKTREDPPPGARITRLEGRVMFKSALILVDMAIYCVTRWATSKSWLIFVMNRSWGRAQKAWFENLARLRMNLMLCVLLICCLEIVLMRALMPSSTRLTSRGQSLKSITNEIVQNAKGVLEKYDKDCKNTCFDLNI